ncbi:restriction endonuclease subunit S [Brachyspira hampsonii]|uniref:restriction endonuclease subunit S n=1 Tax=Brachyspira hampsonii TaxID=1287055 RepID=UPI000D365536|nr:restriction endonuclease subunit S [Brachyspira hampsonii]PTY39418.1 hypothetical protein DQ06_01940 [Brachyspira hampsonii bv. II]
MKKNKLFPRLRFPEFRTNIDFFNGNLLFEQISNKNHNSDLPILAITQDRGAIPRNEIDYNITATEKSISTYKVVEVGDFIISLRSFQGGIEYSNYKGICSPAYIVLRKKNNNIYEPYYKYYFKTDRYIINLNINLEGIRDGKMISYSQFSDIKIPCPTLEEQQKIADCLASIDELIEAEKRKLVVLKKYKKTLTQKLFPAEDASIPELRFEEFKDSGEWENKKLSDIGESYSGLTNKNASHFIDDCNAKYITYKSIYDCDRININKLKDVFIEEGEKQNLVQYGDAFFTISSETQDEVGLSSVLLDEVSNTYLNSFCFGFRYDFNILLPEFARYYFRSNYIRKYTYILSQGITRFNLSKNKFLEIIIKIPTIKEQKKIADCLASIDGIIDSQVKRIDNLIKHKKALMQGLFPDMESIEEYE